MKNKKTLKVIIIIMAIVLLGGGGFAALFFNGLSGVNINTAPADGQIKVACVGDSVTYGHGIPNWPINNYPTVLQDLLGNGYHVSNFGVSGSAVQASSDQPYTSRQQYKESLDYDADIVVFMMGSNDSKPENWKGADVFREELTTLLDSYGDAKILLCTPATAFFTDNRTEGLTNFDIQPLVVDEISEIVHDLASERGYALIDIHSLTACHPEWFEADCVHPDSSGADAIAQEISKFISE